MEQDGDPNMATMEARVATPEGGVRRIRGRWTLDQLRQTDGIIPLQYGTNKFDSQKNMTGFGTPRNTTTRIKAECIAEIPEEIARLSDMEVRYQLGSNKYASQRGMTGMGTGRDVCREGQKVQNIPEGLEPVAEEKALMSEGIVRLQSGTNRFDSQRGMTGFGTARREVTKMKDTTHPDYDCETSIDQAEIPLQSGTNKFASQRGMTGFGTARRETTKMVDTAHPEIDIQHPDPSTIPSQMGSNKYASQKGMTGFGQPRWEALQNPLLSYQMQDSQGIVPSQMGSNQFASQANHQAGPGFGAPRDICHTVHTIAAGELPYEDVRKSELIIPSQAGWNRGDSQRGMTGFGAPRDVKGKHLKRIWELEYPEEVYQMEMMQQLQ